MRPTSIQLMRPAGGFTLVELLVVTGVVVVLLGILLQALSGARQSARMIECAANLRGIGQSLYAYASNNSGFLPAAYVFNCANYYPAPGITHWSGQFISARYTTEDALHCPSFERGGLAPTDTTPGNLEPGQSNNESSYVDTQAVRCAYTLNEALCPQPFFSADPPPHTPMAMCHYVGTTNVDLHSNRLYRTVRLAEVAAAASTILATEWQQNWKLVSGPGYSTANANVSLSYRPVHGFAPVNGNSLDPFDVSLVLPPALGQPGLRHLVPADLLTPGWQQPRLTWVGRNHNRGKITNFLYLDGHVEFKTIERTLSPFEWGRKFYSLCPGDDIASSP